MPLFGTKSSKKPLPRGKQNAPAEKPFVSVGSLFNPNIGASLRPMGQTGKMLVMLIASIFAAHGLFPRNHPALLGVNGARLTLAEVISTGWRNVSFTKERLPQALIFCAVIISLGCSVIAIFAFLLAMVSGSAHAQTLPTGPSMFVAPSPDTDLALGWMNWLFLAKPMATDYLNALPSSTTTAVGGCAAGVQCMPMGAGDSMALSTIIQKAFTSVLGFYSDAILVIAAVVLFYHLTSMIVETAHHGVAMGRRANQVWAPIRLVVAIGLLVPIGAAGLNSGQYILLQIAAWGSGLASNAWAYFLYNLKEDTSGYVPPSAPYDRATVQNIYAAAACHMAWNTIVGSGTVPTTALIPDDGFPEPNPDGSIKWSYTPVGDPGSVDPTWEDLCGFYVQPAPAGSAGFTTIGSDTTIAGNVQTAVEKAFTDMAATAVTNGVQDVQCFMPSSYFPTGTTNANCPKGDVGWAPPNQDLEPMISSYESNLQTDLSTAAAGLSGSMDAAIAMSTDCGWACAGAYWNTFARLQGELTSLPHDMLPKTAPPQIFRLIRENKIKRDTTEAEVAKIMMKFQQWVDRGYNSAISGVMVPAMTGATDQQSALLTAEAGIMQNGAQDKPHYMDYIFEGVDFIASMDGVWNANPKTCSTASCFTLGVQFTSYNPLAEIAAFGHSNLNAAYDIFDEYIILSAATSGLKDASAAAGIIGGLRVIGPLAKAFQSVSTGASGVTEAIGSVIGTIVVVFFTAGFLLAYFLPLIPFYRFLFGILSWFLSLLEGVVSIPLVALAHLTPEGEGFMGDKAKGAYYYTFDIFLRPILMVFGLIAGFLIFDLAASIMNLLYTTAVAGAGGISNGHFTLARLTYSIIYVVILYISCNKCFQLIDWLPEHAIKWMGGSPLQHAPMGDPMDVGGYMGLASGYVEQQIVGGAGKVMSSPMGAAALGGLMEADKSGKPQAILQGALQNMHKQTGAPVEGYAERLVDEFKNKFHNPDGPPLHPARPGGDPSDPGGSPSGPGVGRSPITIPTPHRGDPGHD